jgi:hypothetical protein
MRFWGLTKGVVDADSPGHTLLTLDGGEYFGRILESNWTFSEGVGDGEEVHEADKLAGGPSMNWLRNLQNDGSNLGPTATAVIEEGQTGGQQEDTHEGEGL